MSKFGQSHIKISEIIKVCIFDENEREKKHYIIV